MKLVNDCSWTLSILMFLMILLHSVLQLLSELDWAFSFNYQPH